MGDRHSIWEMTREHLEDRRNSGKIVLLTLMDN